MERTNGMVYISFGMTAAVGVDEVTSSANPVDGEDVEKFIQLSVQPEVRACRVLARRRRRRRRSSIRT